MSFLSKAQASMNAAAASTKKAAIKLKLRTQIDLKRREQREAKAKMGLMMFDAMALNDMAQAHRSLASTPTCALWR